MCTMTDTPLTILQCPRCRKETHWQGNPFRPFCSKRCKTMDLAAWADEEYRIASEDKPADDESNDNE
ncbi:DNA gyrase inhibitor YacG [Rhodocyclaceae bacterium]|nr:DNA gyrase inhibitor YacG [Rhodocyclaceae bacterium]